MKSSRCDTKAARTREILIPHRRLAATSRHSVLSPPPLLSSLFPFKVLPMLAFPIRAYVYHHNHFLSNRRRPLVSLPLCRYSRNRVLPARKLPSCGSWFILSILPVILRRTLHVLLYLALGITSDGRKDSILQTDASLLVADG